MRCNRILGEGGGAKWYDPPGSKGCYCVKRSARGSEGMPPRNGFENRCSEIESEGISESKYCIIILLKD